MVENEFGFLFVLFAVFTLVLSLFSFGLVYMSANSFFPKISGYVTSGETNLTVTTQAEINFSTRSINFGSGRVNFDATAANLFTVADPELCLTGCVTGGNWSANSGMIIENIGNVNVTLNLSVGKNASQFIGGTNPVYEWNLSDTNGGDANSCLTAAGTADSVRMHLFYPANTTPAVANGGLGCAIFNFRENSDRLLLDFNITVPENAITGTLGDVITATAVVTT